MEIWIFASFYSIKLFSIRRLLDTLLVNVVSVSHLKEGYWEIAHKGFFTFTSFKESMLMYLIMQYISDDLTKQMKNILCKEMWIISEDITVHYFNSQVFLSMQVFLSERTMERISKHKDIRISSILVCSLLWISLFFDLSKILLLFSYILG